MPQQPGDAKRSARRLWNYVLVNFLFSDFFPAFVSPGRRMRASPCQNKKDGKFRREPDRMHWFSVQAADARRLARCSEVKRPSRHASRPENNRGRWQQRVDRGCSVGQHGGVGTVWPSGLCSDWKDSVYRLRKRN
ncbi:hypothetical protein SRHO_G00273550 [Serrasalmus rhombeus]